MGNGKCKASAPAMAEGVSPSVSCPLIPIIFPFSQHRYAFLSENFRKAFRKVIACNGGFTKRSADTTADNRADQELTIGMCQKQSSKAFNSNNDV